MVTVQATSQADTNSSASATVTIPEVSVSVDPTRHVFSQGGSQQRQFRATVSNATNTEVTWDVTGGGTIDSTGLFTAEFGSDDIFHVIATSKADDTKTGSATVDVP